MSLGVSAVIWFGYSSKLRDLINHLGSADLRARRPELWDDGYALDKMEVLNAELEELGVCLVDYGASPGSGYDGWNFGLAVSSSVIAAEEAMPFDPGQLAVDRKRALEALEHAADAIGWPADERDSRYWLAPAYHGT